MVAADRVGAGKGRRNSFSGLVELNRCAQYEKSGQSDGSDSTNDAWLSQTVGDPRPPQPGPLRAAQGRLAGNYR